MLRVSVLKLLEQAGIKARAEEVEIPKPEFGDLAYPCFKLAKSQGKDPMEVAESICGQLKLPWRFVQRAEAKSGYVNFYFNWVKLSKLVLKRALKKPRVRPERIFLEYVSANPLHPLHVGTLRNAVLGKALTTMLKWVGHEVSTHFYVNDMGLQVAELVCGFELLNKVEGKPDHWLGKIYAIVDRFIHGDERTLEQLKLKWPEVYEALAPRLKQFEVEARVKELLKLCEGGDPKTLKMFRKVSELCLQGFKETLAELGIYFDSYDFESDFVLNGSVQRVVEKLKQRGVLRYSSECTWVLNLTDFNLPSLTLLRSDGTSLYLTRDIAYHVWKFEQGASRVINVIGVEQSLVQQQLKAALCLLGMKDQAKRVLHYAYEHVRFPGVKISGRRGEYLTIDELLKHARACALKEVKARNPGASEQLCTAVAACIADAAIKYAFLKVEPSKEIVFDLNQALRFEGDTGPYVLYACMRCKGILKRVRKFKHRYSIPQLSTHERELLRVLAELSNTLKRAAQELSPHLLCSYVYALAYAFNSFYEHCPVLGVKSKLKEFRLTVVEVCMNAFLHVIKLLGMEVPEFM